jgi:hypothetical protein
MELWHQSLAIDYHNMLYKRCISNKKECNDKLQKDIVTSLREQRDKYDLIFKKCYDTIKYNP